MGALRLKDVDALVQEYRRLAPLGTLAALALAAAPPQAQGGPPRVSCPGRLSHLASQELRVRDVTEMLREYHVLHRLAAGPSK